MLEKLGAKHKLWIKMALDLGVNLHKAEDFVQDLYIKLYELEQQGKDFSYNDDVNIFYVFLTMKSLRGQKNRELKKQILVKSLDAVLDEESGYTREEGLIAVDTDIEEQEAFESVYKRVMTVINDLPNHPDYPQYLKDKAPHFINLFVGYNTTDKSMRQISKETGIRLGTIHQVLNKVMDIVKAEVGDDVADYFNKDYHLI